MMNKTFKMLLFVAGVVAPILLFIPVLIGKQTGGRPPAYQRMAAFPAWAVGGALALQTVLLFRKEGGGTPAPNAPTEALVVSGLYRYTRNPMYIGALLIVVGHAIWFGAASLLAYASALAVFFHGVITIYEEPRLREQFGEAYKRYSETVPRWFGAGGKDGH